VLTITGDSGLIDLLCEGRSAIRTVIIFILLVAIVPAAGAQTTVRVGEENPVATIAKATLWGGLAGLVLGGATALVVDDNEEEIVKWFFVGGTFFGFGYGLYHVSTRKSADTGLLDIDSGGLAVSAPSIGLSKVGSNEAKSWKTSVTLLTLTF